MSDLPDKAKQDCFRPPDVPVEVFCLHCHQVYESYLIWWEAREGEDGKETGFWRCPTPGCDGAGFCFDIFPIDPEYVHPDTGEKIGGFFNDDDEDDEDEDFGVEHDAEDFDVDETIASSHERADHIDEQINALPLMNDEDDEHHHDEADRSIEQDHRHKRDAGRQSSSDRNRYEPGDPSRWMR